MHASRLNRNLQGKCLAGGSAFALLIAACAAYRAQQRRRYAVRDRVVLITGSSRGFGLAMAERFARAGARVVLSARSEEALERARGLLIERAATTAERLLAFACDVRDAAQVETLFREIEARWSPVEVLVNNAGVISVGPVEAQTLDGFDHAMRTNYYGMLHCSLAALPGMLQRGDGAIVNIASVGGKVSVPHLLPYSASKFACVGFSQGLHAEVRHKGVRVTTVCPGLLRTGSPAHASFSGAREKEYRWFNLGASLPGVSRNAYAAAGRILRAAETAEIELSITPQAALAARLAPVFPGLSARVLSLVSSLMLPDPDPAATQPLPGSMVQGENPAWLTGAGRKAAHQWNEE